ncbi:hypothetical protein [Amycolatopsis sp. NBC_01480]|uniref:hypothetical protein n=1 Tax=Amycolatopsis sp. NBC_01480 TaxID=2903562 RepID=UPI002E2D934A|nr:hypothetical protein [Amycolatopsis sp. NBC_01480]
MFDLTAYLRRYDQRVLETSRGRRAACRLDPLLFGVLYLSAHMRGDETGGEITLSEFHADIVKQALQWVVPAAKPGSQRSAYVAPRSCGKSTWFYLILPMWAAAHGHRRFAAAFADSATQAETHLASFKRELETNALLRLDFPDLCTPMTRSGGTKTADNRGLYQARSGFVFAARGVDSSALGLKVGNTRPDLLIIDDIEPDEASYSLAQKDKRLSTLLDAILPLNVYAAVVVVGTVTMAGSLVHDLVKSVTLPSDTAQWVRDEGFQAYYYPALITDPQTGSERSIWPEKWSLEYLQSIRHTRSFLKNYQNDPMGADGEYWRPEDFTHAEVHGIARQLLSIDPAVTATDRSDYTALAVVGYSPLEQRAVVRDAWQLRIQPGRELRNRVLQILDAYPETAGVLIETNQGGETWRAILHDLPVPITTVHQSDRKEVRAARLLTRYQRGLVVHEKPLPAAEGQMVAFPKAPFDDLVDAIGSGVAAILPKNHKQKPAVRSIGVA